MARSRGREILSQRAYAKRIGVTHQAVSLAVKAGRISTVNGKIDPVRADREWEASTDPSKPRNRITGDPKHRRDPSGPSQPMDLGRSEGRGRNTSSSDYAAARAAREAIMARLKKHELDLKLGLVVPKDEVIATAASEAQRTRDQLRALPERLAVIVAATQDPAEVHRILDEAIERICEEIASADRD